jgi:hypothetical protein
MKYIQRKFKFLSYKTKFSLSFVQKTVAIFA